MRYRGPSNTSLVFEIQNAPQLGILIIQVPSTLVPSAHLKGTARKLGAPRLEAPDEPLGTTIVPPRLPGERGRCGFPLAPQK